MAAQVAVDVLHVLAASVWVGGLASLVLVLPNAVAARRFSRIALVAVLVLGATGVLLITIGATAVLAFVAALSRADWRVLDLGPLYALASAVVRGAGHGLFWFASAPGRALRTRLPARLGSVLSFAIAIVAFACLLIGARLPEGAPGAVLLVKESSPETRFIIGHENSPLHGKTEFGL